MQIELASPLAILLPLNLLLVKFIPNLTPTSAITYKYETLSLHESDGKGLPG